LKFAVVSVAIALVASTAGAQESRAAMHSPAQAEPGSIVRISLNAPTGRDSIVAIEGTMSGEPLHFHRAAPGVWHTIGAISPDAKTEATAQAIVSFASGRADTLSAVTRIPAAPPSHGKPPRSPYRRDSRSRSTPKHRHVSIARMPKHGRSAENRTIHPRCGPLHSFGRALQLSPAGSVPAACSTARSQAATSA
jgi:hypothetical protein